MGADRNGRIGFSANAFDPTAEGARPGAAIRPE